MIDPRVASGLRDLPPATALPRERMLAAFRAAFASFGYLPIETPHIERMEVLTGKGAGSDEVLRQIFDVTNKGGTPGELALRFDLTVPLARFVAKHVDELGTPFKRYAIGSVFRGERPAKGRFREFTQCDFDTIGTESPTADAEIVQVVVASLQAAGVPAFTVWLNDRRVLDGLLGVLGAPGRTGAVLRSLDKLAKVGREAVARELSEGEHAPLSAEQAARVLDLVERGRGGVGVLDEVGPDLAASDRGATGLSGLRRTFALLDAAGVDRDRVKVDLGLARGLDYYTGLVFETTVDGWERFGSVCSGGRYDDLASLFTNRKLPGVGGSIGIDRLIALLEEAGKLGGSAATAAVLVAQFPGVEPTLPVSMGARLRAAGIGTEVFPDAIAVGKQMAYGSSRGHRVAVIVGPDEAARGVFNVRDLATRKERRGIAVDQLESTVAAALAGTLEFDAGGTGR